MKELTLDCETTGLPAKGHTYEKDFLEFPRIVTLAWQVNDLETKYFIINQEGYKIPQEAIDVHGITNEMCEASEYTLARVLADLLFDGQDSEIVIGHNIYFDTSTIKANILRLLTEGKVVQSFYNQFTALLDKDRRIDTMQSTIKFCNLPGKYAPKWPKLTELHFKLFNEGFEAHNSKDDVQATRRCFKKLLEMGIIVLPIPETL